MFHTIKLYVVFSLGNNVISTTSVPGYVYPFNFAVTHVSGGVYTFTPAHPNGNFLVFVTPRTSAF